MKNARSKKKLIGSNEEENEEINNSSSSNISEDENGSQENSGGTTLNSNGKTRASRGSATDPQSLYARVISFSTYFHIKNKNLCIFMILIFIIFNFAEKKREDK